MKLVLISVLAYVAILSNTGAVALTFKLDVFSSGSDIYACNAGLMHDKYASRVCYERDNPERDCNPQLCEEGQTCNCVCSGSITGQGDGEYRLDYLAASHRTWSDHGEIKSSTTSTKVEAGITSFNQVFNDNVAMNNELSNLTFNLGSERYGAVYFLDVCFRATQIRYPDAMAGKINWALDRQITITDLANNGFNYEKLSKLLVKSSYVCNDKNGATFSFSNDTWKPFNSSQVINYSTKYFQNDLATCKVRYFFKESNDTGVESLRKWNLQHARVCTYTSLNEPLVNQ